MNTRILGYLIRIPLTVWLLVEVYEHAHWSVFVSLLLLFVVYEAIALWIWKIVKLINDIGEKLS